MADTPTPTQQPTRTHTPTASPTAADTSTPTPRPTPTFTPTPGPAANVQANLRAGPGLQYAIVGGRNNGDRVHPIAQTQDGLWLELSGGQWIYAPLVDNQPTNLPIAHNIPPTPIPLPTPIPPPTPLPLPTPIPVSAPTVKPKGFGDGIWVVGKDIVSGTYYSIKKEPLSGSCFWERLADFNNTYKSSIAYDFEIHGYTIVTIKASDKGFTSKRCGQWRPFNDIIEQQQSLFGHSRRFGDGIWIVGKGIASGTYRSDNNSNCSWQKLSAFDTGHGVIANDYSVDGPIVITIHNSDKVFTSFHCNQWNSIE